MAKRLLLFLFLLYGLGACKYSRYVPDGDYLLWENKLDLVDGGRASALAEGVIRQKPNDNLIFNNVRPGLGLYSWGNGKEGSFWSRLGTKPVIFDINSQKTSRTNLRSFYFNRGYFQAEVISKVKYNEKRKRATVTYDVKRGPRYRISKIEYDINESLQEIDLKKAKNSLIKIGQYYDLNRLDAERLRIRDIYRNNGYYNFSESYISYDADTNNSNGEHLVALKLSIKGIPKRVGDSIIYKNPTQYRMRNIHIVPDYNFQFGSKAKDTLAHRNYYIAYDDLAYKPRYLTDAIHLYPGSLYRQRLVDESYQHLASYNAFNVNEIIFKPVETSEGTFLDAEVRLVPRDKRTYLSEVEVTNTSGNYGIRGSIGIINRNLFGGGEALSFNITSGLEYQPTVANNENLSRTFELGAELRVDIPRFLLPFNTEGLLPKRMLPRSSLSIYASRIARIEFDRETFGGRLSYQWNESTKKNHKVDLLSISFSNLFSIDTNFINQLDPIQSLAFNSEFISSTSYSFTYSGQESVSQRTYHFFNSNVEIGGSLQSLLTRSVGEVNENQVSRLFGVPIYQFGRLEMDYRYYFHPSPEQLYIFRLSGGMIRPFGLSAISIGDQVLRLPPFSRFFFLGGTNDLRAWPAYRAGGGTAQVSNYSGANNSSFAIGTLKLLTNLEYRFPIYSSLKGALFVDAGNIWLTGGLETEESRFEFQNLGRDLYIGSGLGLRLDLDFFVIRLDTGLRLRDPGYLASGDEWVILSKPVFPNLTYNVALGYPF